MKMLGPALLTLAVALAVGGVALWNAGSPAAAIFCGIAAAWTTCGGAMARRPVLGLAMVGFMGLLVSLYLGYQHHELAGSSACSVSSTFDCDAVNRSPQSEIRGLPIAFLGSAWFAGIAAAALSAWRKPGRHGFLGGVAVGTGVLGLVYCAFLAWVSVQLGRWCLFCISLYGATALVTLGGWLVHRESGHGLGHALARGVLSRDEDRTMSVLSGVGIVVLVVAMFVYTRPTADGPLAVVADPTGDEYSPSDLEPFFMAPREPLVLTGHEPSLGSENAPYTVVEFADFGCPFCAETFPGLHEFGLTEERVRVVFKHYPLSSQCNPALSSEMHPMSCGAALAAECANRQDRFWEMATLLFANPDDQHLEGMRQMAAEAGLDVPTWEACLTDPATSAAVLADVQAGNQAGVYSTPSLFIRGLKGRDWVYNKQGLEGMVLLLQAHLSGLELPPTPPWAPPE